MADLATLTRAKYAGRFLHGESYKSPEYVSWTRMKYRVRASGGKIGLCERWDSFELFLADMGRKPGLGYSIDRIDSEGSYEPANCRWATRKEQSRNTRIVRIVEFNGEEKPLTELAEIYGVNPRTLANRLDSGWSINRALAKKVCSSRSKASYSRKHGDSRSVEYRVWKQIRQRCNNPVNQDWKYYGGRGIRMCERWSDYALFISDVGRRPDLGYSLDRNDSNGNYEPSNCHWVTCKDQQRNRRNNRVLLFRGELRCLQEWAELVGVSDRVVRRRLGLGWPVEAALTTPIKERRRGHS